MAHSMNSHCNKCQAIQGFFLKSVNAPECVIDILAHGSWSISVVSIVNMVHTLTKDHKKELKKLSETGLCVIAYDNLDFDFGVKEPTVENAGTFASITMGSFIQLTPDTTLGNLSFLRELWERSDLNPCGPKDSMPPTPPPYEYVVDQIKDAPMSILQCCGSLRVYWWRITSSPSIKTFLVLCHHQNGFLSPSQFSNQLE